MRFKSAINRAPRQKTPGWPGEKKSLKLELKVLADVGLLGMPNAGKSTLITAISNARPRIADYPFTTLHPNLGVVRVGPEQSFVVADLPGLIEGAAEGAGLGHLFLRHLQRTRLLLHVVDMAPFDDAVDVVAQAKAIVNELKKYDPALHKKPRWLVLNKLDMVADDARAALVKDFVRRFKFKGPVFEISALTHQGCDALVQAVYKHIAAQQKSEQPPLPKKRRAPRHWRSTHAFPSPCPIRRPEPARRPASIDKACNARRQDRLADARCQAHRGQGRIQPGDRRGPRA